MAAPPQHASLLGLPPELRTLIYEHALRKDGPLRGRIVLEYYPLRLLHPSLPLICQQIHNDFKQDAGSLLRHLLSHSIIVFEGAEDVQRILRLASSQTLGHLLRVRVTLKVIPMSPLANLPANPPFQLDTQGLTHLSGLPKLQELRFPVGSIDSIAGPRADIWTDTHITMRDARYNVVVQQMLQDLPANLPKLRRVNISCHMQLKPPGPLAHLLPLAVGNEKVYVQLHCRKGKQGAWKKWRTMELQDGYYDTVSPFGGLLGELVRLYLDPVYYHPRRLVRHHALNY